MLNILVAGSVDLTGPLADDARSFCAAMARTVVERGHCLLNGCKNPIDRILAESAATRLTELESADAAKRLVSYVMPGREPIHAAGTIIRSRVTDWDLTDVNLTTPEQIELADVVIVFGGHDGTTRAANWARIRNKNLLPVTRFGGAAEALYDSEFDRFDARYAEHIDRVDFGQLATVGSDWSALAERLVALAEKVAAPRGVVALMSYSGAPELDDTYDTFQTACAAHGYLCERVDQLNALGQIVPEIKRRIEASAFVIVDLTDLRPNVFYELGYADGLRKPLILTAREGTELPFDIKDQATLFWKSQKRLRDELSEKIRLIAERHGRR